MIDFKTVNTVLSHAFNLKICLKYAVVGIVYLVVCGLFLTVKFSCLFTAVAVLASLLKVYMKRKLSLLYLKEVLKL